MKHLWCVEVIECEGADLLASFFASRRAAAKYAFDLAVSEALSGDEITGNARVGYVVRHANDAETTYYGLVRFVREENQ